MPVSHRRSTSIALLLAAAAAAATAPTRHAMAIGGPGTQQDTHNFVGRIVDETNATGTGSMIKPNAQASAFVLTAAHCINYTKLNETPNGTPGLIRQHFERFRLQGTTFFGLGVQHPKFAAQPDNFIFSSDQGDIGFVLLLNRAPADGGSFGTILEANQEAVVADVLDIVGFTGAVGNNALKGTAKVDAVPNGNDFVNFKVPPGPNWTQPGDSGGPTFKTFDGSERIVAVHSGGKVDTPPGGAIGSFFDVRVNAYRPFVLGDGANLNDGQGVRATVVRLKATGQKTWGAAGDWARGSANAAAAPGANDVVVIDPTDNSGAADVTTTVVTNIPPGGTPIFEGLLNDAHLPITGGSLRVGGRTGVLNGGHIQVGTDVLAGGAEIGHSIDNVGTVEVRRGIATIGVSLPQNSWALWNNSGGRVTVGGNGILNVGNPNHFRTGFFNADGARLSVSGTSTIDNIENHGLIEVLPAGTASFGSIDNKGTGVLRVSGTPGTPDSALVRTNYLVNVGQVQLNAGTTMRVNEGGIGAAVGPFLDNRPGARFTIESGARVEGKNWFRNGGDFVMKADFISRSVMTIRPEIVGGDSAIEHSGNAAKLAFEAANPIAGPKPVIELISSEFTNDAEITGPGEFVMRGTSDFRQTRVPVAARDDHNFLDLHWLAAAGAMEIPGEDSGQDPDALTQPMSLNRFCLEDQSLVTLEDDENNEDVAGAEVLYTRFLGISDMSVLNLNGFTLYYQFQDPNCWDGTGVVIPGTHPVTGEPGRLVQIPEPALGAALLVCAASLMCARRRRAAAA